MTACRIHIIGSTGSGKTYAATHLAKRLGIPNYDLDDLFWDRDAPAYGTRASPEIRDRELAKIVEKDSWIIEGVYHHWLAPSFERADLIVALTPHVLVRDARIIKRFILRKLGTLPAKRESLRDVGQLIRWNHAYDQDNYVRAIAFIQAKGRKVFVCRSASEVFAAVGLSVEPL